MRKDTSPYAGGQKKKSSISFEPRNTVPWTGKQKELLNIIDDKNSKVIFLRGPSGTSKTFIAVYAALKALAEKKISDIIYIRSVVESSSNKMGYLPGDGESKLSPYCRPLEDKLEELVDIPTQKKLKDEKLVTGIPVNFLRGAHFSGKFIICDEMQNCDKKELTTILTRVGEFSKIILCGDPMQSDLAHDKSAFASFYNAFHWANHPNIKTFSFDEDDIVRSKILKDILEIITSMP